MKKFITSLLVFAIMQGLYMLRFTEIKQQEKEKLKAEKETEKIRLKEERAAKRKHIIANRNKAGAKLKYEEEEYDFEEW